eukprot:4743857-Amphidinium_carterae.2
MSRGDTGAAMDHDPLGILHESPPRQRDQDRRRARSSPIRQRIRLVSCERQAPPPPPPPPPWRQTDEECRR